MRFKPRSSLLSATVEIGYFWGLIEAGQQLGASQLTTAIVTEFQKVLVWGNRKQGV
jgi:N-acyl-L-homoserine lactone synthetase